MSARQSQPAIRLPWIDVFQKEDMFRPAASRPHCKDCIADASSSQDAAGSHGQSTASARKDEQSRSRSHASPTLYLVVVGFPLETPTRGCPYSFCFFYGLTGVGLLGPDEPRYASIGREMAAAAIGHSASLGRAMVRKATAAVLAHRLGLSCGIREKPRVRVPDRAAQRGISIPVLSPVAPRIRRKSSAVCLRRFSRPRQDGWRILMWRSPIFRSRQHSPALSALFLPWVRSGGRRGLIIGGLLLGLAVLAKGLVPLVLALPVVWIARRRWADLLMMAGCVPRRGCALVRPLLDAQWQVFIDEFIIKHHFGRFFSPELQHVQPWWFYVPVLLGLLFPWTPALVAAIPPRGVSR